MLRNIESQVSFKTDPQTLLKIIQNRHTLLKIDPQTNVTQNWFHECYSKLVSQVLLKIDPQMLLKIYSQVLLEIGPQGLLKIDPKTLLKIDPKTLLRITQNRLITKISFIIVTRNRITSVI